MRLQVKKIPYCAGNRGCGIGFKAQRKGGLNLARQVLAGGVSLLSLAGGTFTRATSAWDPIAQAIAPPGVMRTLTQSLVPTLQDILALIEGARTNLFAAGSGEFQAGWSSTRSSLVAGSWTDPSGGSGVMLAEDSTASNTHMCFQAVNITNALPYTCTVYAKAGLRSVIVLQFGSTAFTTPTAWFDLSAGAVSKTSGS